MTIKRVNATIRQVEQAGLSQNYRFTIVGNYHSEASHLIKAALLQRLLEVKKLVIGTRAKQMTVVLTGTEGLSSLSARTCRQLGIQVAVEPEITPEQREQLELVLTVRLVPGPKVGEAQTEQLEQQFEQAVEPWDDNDKQFEIKVPVAIDLKAKPAIDLTKVDLPDLINDKRNNYSPFSKIDEWKDQNIIEVEPTIDRNEIPAYGPGIQPDGNKAGGLQES